MIEKKIGCLLCVVSALLVASSIFLLIGWLL